jgi:hypothetical protein
MKKIISRIHPYLAHVPDETLVDMLSGELSSFRRLKANLHLSHCWQCRTRREELEKAAHAVVSFRRTTLAQCMPLEDRHRRSFLARLESTEKSPFAATPESRASHRFPRMLVHMNPIFASTIVVAVAAVLLVIIWQRQVPGVTASELLMRAEAADQQQTHEHAAGVVYQQVSIAAGQRQIQHAIYRDITGRRKARRSELSGDEQAVRRRLDEAGVDWEQPLSAAGFRIWRDRQQILREEVRRAAAGELMLITKMRSGDIQQESLTVRSADFHPIRRTIQMRNRETIEVAELNYAVLGWNAVNDALFEPLQPAHVALAPLAAIAALPAPPLPTLAQLLDAEVRARVALHATGADLGESVQINLGAVDSAVHVQGMLATAERKDELIAALDEIPHLAVHLQTVDEAAETTPPANTVAAGRVTVVDQQPALEAALIERFPDEDKRRQFVDQALNAADLAMAHAWAIRKIEERYPGPQLSLLEPSDRQMLQLLIKDHLTILQEQVFAVHRSMKELLGWPPGEPHAGVESPGPERGQLSLPALFDEVNFVQHDVRALLTQSPAGPEPTESRVASLRQRLSTLEDSLPDLAARTTRVY